MLVRAIEREARVVHLDRSELHGDRGRRLGVRAPLRPRRRERADVDADRLAGGAGRARLVVEQRSRAPVAGRHPRVEFGARERADRRAQRLPRAPPGQVGARVFLVADHNLGRHEGQALSRHGFSMDRRPRHRRRSC